MSWVGLRVGAWEIEASADVPAEGTWMTAFGPSQRPTVRGAIPRAPRFSDERVWVSVLPLDADRIGRVGLRTRYDALARLDDARIPAALGYVDAAGAYAVAATPGVPLTRVIEGRRDRVVALDPATLLDLVIDLCDAMSHAHQRRVTHGRLWPGCVWITLDGRLIVWGFGGPSPVPAAWALPDRVLDERADQAALGGIAVALVTGRPFAGTAPVDAQWPALGRVLRRMTEADPSERFESVAAARQALVGLARRAGLPDRRPFVAWLYGLPFDDVAELEPEAISEESGVDVDDTEVTDVPPASVDAIDAPVPRVPDRRPDPRQEHRLPEEPLVVVRPEVAGEVPIATVRPPPARPADGAGLTFPPRREPDPADVGDRTTPALPSEPQDSPPALLRAPPPPSPSPSSASEPPMPPRPVSLPIEEPPSPPVVEIEFDDTDEFAFDPPSGPGLAAGAPVSPLAGIRIAEPSALAGPTLEPSMLEPRPPVRDPISGGPTFVTEAASVPQRPAVPAVTHEPDGLAIGTPDRAPPASAFPIGRVAALMVLAMVLMMGVWVVVRGVG